MTIQYLSVLIPLVIITTLYASILKLSARLLGLGGVTWPRAFGFAFLVVLLSTLARVAATYVGLQTQTIAGAILGIAVHLGFGSWFFRDRATTRDGQSVGWAGAARLSAVTIGFLIVTVALLMGGLRVLTPQA